MTTSEKEILDNFSKLKKTCSDLDSNDLKKLITELIKEDENVLPEQKKELTKFILEEILEIK